MSEFKGTPGPWRFDDLNMKVKAVDDSNPSYQTVIADVSPRVNFSKGKTTQNYNAQLIASAPELLTALNVAIKILKLEGWSDKEGLIASMNNAINKALGKEIESHV